MGKEVFEKFVRGYERYMRFMREVVRGVLVISVRFFKRFMSGIR